MGTTSAASPTVAPLATTAGMIVGTVAYMAPEQARGKAVDKRADIWAFGALLFEMITGQRPFEGETVSDTLAAVLTRDVDLARLPPTTPDAIRTLLSRCLERDVTVRLRDIGEESPESNRLASRREIHSVFRGFPRHRRGSDFAAD